MVLVTVVLSVVVAEIIKLSLLLLNCLAEFSAWVTFFRCSIFVLIFGCSMDEFAIVSFLLNERDIKDWVQLQ